MREMVQNPEQGTMTLRDITDHLLLDHRTVEEITNYPRSFRVKAVSREDLLAPTALPFEIGLSRVGGALVAVTGGKTSVPTDFGLGADTEILKQTEQEHARAGGWYAHWHPIGWVVGQPDLPSYEDVEEDVDEGVISFMFDKHYVNVYYGVKRLRKLVQTQEKLETTPEMSPYEVFGIQRHVYEKLLFEKAGLKQIPWSEKERIARVCDFMNGKISQTQLEESL